MLNRCKNPDAPNYERYGGRGITVYSRWERFEDFLEDMGQRPEGTTIDRINNDGNYEPDNCRWATAKQQQNNTNANVNISFNGETNTMAQWADKLGINYHTLHTRFDRGWTVERALTWRIEN